MDNFDDLLIKYNSQLLKLKHSIFELNKEGFDLKQEQDKIEQVESDTNKRLFLLNSDSDEEAIKNLYKESIEKLEKIELSHYIYYKFYNDCEDIIKKLRSVDVSNINEIITQVLSLLEAIREGLIIISDEDRYLLEKVFKTIYEVLKVSFLYGKGKELLKEINEVEIIKAYVNKYIEEDVKKIDKSNTSSELKQSVHMQDNNTDSINENLVATIGIIENSKIKESHKLDKINNIDKNNVVIEENDVLEKEDNQGNKVKEIAKIGLVIGASMMYNDSKINKTESNDLVKGDEKILPIDENNKLVEAEDDFFEEHYIDTNVDDDNNLSLFYDEDVIEEFDQALNNADGISEVIPEKLKNDYKENEEFVSNWFNLLPMIMNGGKFIGKAMLFALFGAEKAKSIENFIKKNGITKDNYKQKTLEYNNRK